MEEGFQFLLQIYYMFGDKLEVSKPEGRFVLEPEKGKNYLAIAAGSGITPIMAMLKASLHDDSTFYFDLW